MIRDELAIGVRRMERFLEDLGREEPGSEEYSNTLDLLTCWLEDREAATEQLSPEIAQAVKIIETRKRRLEAKERREEGCSSGAGFMATRFTPRQRELFVLATQMKRDWYKQKLAELDSSPVGS